MGKLFAKLFGTYSERQIKRLEETVRKIEDLGEKYAAMSEQERADYAQSWQYIHKTSN